MHLILFIVTLCDVTYRDQRKQNGQGWGKRTAKEQETLI